MEPSHKYLLIQRCRPFGVWPQDFLFQDEQREVELQVQDQTYKLMYRFAVRTYDDQSFANAEADDPPRFGHLVVDEAHVPGFRVGGKILKGPDDVVPVSIRFRNVQQGEIDFFIGIGCSKEVPRDALLENFTPLMVTFIASLETQLNDLIITTAPPILSKLREDDASELQCSSSIGVRARPILNTEAIVAAFPSFFKALSMMSAEGAQQVSVAMRRYQSSMIEKDPIDRFCDLWETCEFLSKVKVPGGRKITKSRPYEIAFLVSANMKRRQHDVKIMIIDKLYDVRNDLVHNAIADPEGFQDWIQVMEDVALQSIRYVFSMGPVSTPRLNEMLGE